VAAECNNRSSPHISGFRSLPAHPDNAVNRVHLHRPLPPTANPILPLNPRSSTAAATAQRPPVSVRIHNERNEPMTEFVDAITGELYVQMHLGRSGGDNLAKIPFAVVPVRAGTGEKVAKSAPG